MRKPDITPIFHIDSFDNNELYIKREDFLPFSFGGNKARKAALFFDEIDSGGYDAVVTYGSSSSNHCRVVANLACSRGLRCVLIQPEEQSEPTYNSMMSESVFGAEIVTVPVDEVHDTIEALLTQMGDNGFHPYFIPGGGHGNLGTQAYVDCYNEIVSYEQEHHLFFDYLFFASGTGTTQAGLVCGQLIHRDNKRIVGISIARRNPRGRDVVVNSVKEYLCDNNILFDEDAVDRAVIFDDGFIGGGYARDSKPVADTITEVMRRYGIPLDKAYTGKAFYGMKQYLRREAISGCNILFIHTGGTPLFFDFLRGKGS